MRITRCLIATRMSSFAPRYLVRARVRVRVRVRVKFRVRGRVRVRVRARVRVRVVWRARPVGPASQNASANWPRLAEAGGRPELDLALAGRAGRRIGRCL